MPQSTRRSPRFRRHLLALGLSLASTLTWADSIGELHQLVEGNDPAAWEMAVRMEPDFSGDPEFDFWYGLAAKASGHKHEAEFAFERVVLSQPGNARAKLELADTYYQYGNTGEARKLFEEVLATQPPEPVEKRVREYLSALGATEKQHKTQVSGFFSFGGGHDSNINGSTAQVVHDIGVLTVTLDPTSVQKSANFADFRGGVSVVQPVGQREINFLNVTAQRRDNVDLLSGGNFDYTQLSASAGKAFRRGAATWRVPVSVQALWAESESVGPANDDRFVETIGLEYDRPLSANTGINWFGQAGAMQYPSTDDRDALMFLLGVGANWNAKDVPFRVSGTLHAGTEPVRESAFEYNGRSYVAARVNLRYTLTAKQSVYGAAGVQQSNYQGTHPVLGFKREDLLVDASAGWQLQLDDDWSVNLDLSWAENASSDNNLFDYDRTQAKLGATRRF